MSNSAGLIGHRRYKFGVSSDSCRRKGEVVSALKVMLRTGQNGSSRVLQEGRGLALWWWAPCNPLLPASLTVLLPLLCVMAGLLGALIAARAGQGCQPCSGIPSQEISFQCCPFSSWADVPPRYDCRCWCYKLPRHREQLQHFVDEENLHVFCLVNKCRRVATLGIQAFSAENTPHQPTAQGEGKVWEQLNSQQFTVWGTKPV